MERKTRQAIIGTSIALIIIFSIIIASIIKVLKPSDKVMELTDYYQVNDGEVLIVMQDSIYEKKGILDNGRVYSSVPTHFM